MYLGFPIFIIPHSGGKVKGFSEFFRILQRETVDTDSIGFYFLQKGARRMTFSSLIFLFAFLPLTLAAYYLFPRGWRNAVLLAAGLLFCAWDRPASLLPLLWETLAADTPEGQKPVIDAWILTHPHYDHIAGVHKFAQRYSDAVEVRNFVMNLSLIHISEPTRH